MAGPVSHNQRLPLFFMTSRDDPPVAAPVSPNGGFLTKVDFQKDHLPYIYGDEQWDFERYIYIHMSHCSSLKDMMNYGNEPLTTKKIMAYHSVYPSNP